MRKALSVLLVAALCCGIFVGCGKSVEMEDENINEYSFQVLDDWEDGDNSDYTQYYYPKGGMLMVGYSEMNGSITDDSTRNEFISSFGSTMESFELISEDEVNIADTKGYRHEINVVMAEKEWKSSMVTFDCDGGVISFMMSTLQNSKEDYNKEFESVLASIKRTGGSASQGKNNTPIVDAESVRQQLEVKAVPTLDGLMCVFVTNNSGSIIDELDVQLIYKDESGTTIDTDDDGHDMVLPGRTVVSRMETPESYVDFEVMTSVELGVNPNYENHAANVMVNSNQGDNCIIVEIQNNSEVSIDEIEYVAVLYKGDQIVTVEYPEDISDVAAGQKITEKIETYNQDYDRFEIYLNQAHTFGL